MKLKQKKTAVYDIFRKSEDPNYPQQLARFIGGDNFPHDIQKAQYLLDIWVETFKNMPQIDKSKYYTIIPKLLKSLYSIFANKNKGCNAIVIMYYMYYKKWNQITIYLQKGLKQSKIHCLYLFWNICHNMIEPVNQVQKSVFGEHLAQHFQDALSKYKWSTHKQKLLLLQSVKYINSHQPYNKFIANGKKWAQIINTIKQQAFKTEIKDQKQLQLFKYQYEQKKRQAVESLMMATGGVMTARKQTIQKAAQKQKSSYEIQREKQIQKQFLSREQINVFLIVKDEKQQKQIYRIQILTQIINSRQLLCIICQQYWQSLCYDAVLQICKRMQQLNYDVRTDVLLSKLFLNLLKYKKTAELIRQKIGEQIVVKIIKNIQSLQNQSPFQHGELSQIPTLVNQAFFYISPALIAQGVTIKTIINKRIRSIIDQANGGKEDIVNRSLMMVSCRQKLELNKATMIDIVNFLMTLKKKKGIFIQTCIILVKILISAFESPQFRQLQLLQLCLCLTEISQNYLLNKKVNQLRKLNLQLLKLIIPIIYVDETDQGILIQAILKWFLVVQINFNIVYCPMIDILTLLINKYKEYFTTMPKTTQDLAKICQGMKQKLGHQHNSDNMFAFLNCLLTAYVKLQFTQAYAIYQDIPQSSFIDWEIIYQKQARIIFKKEDINKIKKKQKEELQKKNKQKQWQNSLGRKTVQNKTENKTQSTKDSLNSTTLNATVTVMTPELIQKQKQCEQKMKIFFGEKEKQWFRDLIRDHELWENKYIIKSQFGVLQFSILQTIHQSQKQYYSKTNRPNEFWKRIIKQLDSDLCKLFTYLMDVQSYQLLFLFTSKIYLHCRDFFFVIKLKSYQLVQTKCFQILSIFFNKVQILYASSFFCSLILPYVNFKQLRDVFDYLNQQQFLTDLFRGSNEFIGKQKCYFPWLIKILMAYQATQQFLIPDPMVKQALITLGKNVTWWGNVEYMINAEIDIEQFQTDDEKKKLIFHIFKEQYKKLVDKYYSEIHDMITLTNKKRQFEKSILNNSSAGISNSL